METDLSHVTFRPMTVADATAIARWRYPAPYDFYDLEPGEFDELLDPASGCRAAVDATGDLIGFCCLGEGGRVPGAARAGLYAEDALDVGLGLRPDLTGRGLGLAFVRAALTEGRTRFAPTRFRLAVAAFNLRAIRVYQRAGFTAGQPFTSPVRGEECPCLLMTRPAEPD